MFDRFSSRALRVVFHARDEVARRGSSAVEPEHILLGLLEGQGLASRILAPGLGDETRFDFLMMLPQEETTAACLGLLRSAIEQHFAVDVTREPRLRDVHVLADTGARGRMLRRYPEPGPGWGRALVPFSVFRRRSPDAPMFPLDPFAVHSVPFFLLVSWFEEILGGEVIDDTRLPGIYGFELKEPVSTPDAFRQLLRDEAGLAITRQRRETPTLVVRRRDAGAGPA